MWKFLECSLTSSPRWVYIVQYPIKAFFSSQNITIPAKVWLHEYPLIILERTVRMFNPSHAGWGDKSLLKAYPLSSHQISQISPCSQLTHTSNHISCWKDFDLLGKISLRKVPCEAHNPLLDSCPVLWRECYWWHCNSAVLQFHKVRFPLIPCFFYAVLHLNYMKGTADNPDIRPAIIPNLVLLFPCISLPFLGHPRLAVSSPLPSPYDRGLWLC